MKRNAFTLIELLVVISIIALLLAILSPALTKVREQAKTLVCSTRLKQITLAYNIYTTEYKGKLMVENGTSGQYYWAAQLAPFLGDSNFATATAAQRSETAMQIARCPSANNPNPDIKTNMNGRGTNKTAWQISGGYGSYAINGWMTYFDSPTNYHRAFWDSGVPKRFFRNMSEAKSDTPIFGDSVWLDAFPYGEYTMWIPDIYPPGSGKYFHCPPSTSATDKLQQMGRFTIDRHNVAINLGFSDGHVGKVDLENLWSYRWSRSFPTTISVDLPRNWK